MKKAITQTILVSIAIGLSVFYANPSSAEAEYRLGAGDKVKITVFGHEDLSGEFVVDGTGRVSLPLIKNVRAVGLSQEELEESITQRLKPDYLKDPRVSVEVLNYRPFYIIGEIKNPGSYPYVNGIKVVNAVAMAGGYTYRAKKEKAYIIRGNDQTKEKEQVEPTSEVLPGDVIEIPERFF